MLWKEITFTLTREDVETYEDALMLLGACSITLKDAQDNPIFEPGVNETPLWAQLQLTALFTEEFDLTLILNQLLEVLPIKELPTYTTRNYPDEDWERSWMEHFKPIQLGNRLWICPSWHEIPQPNAVNIILDPGLAFGTGSHPTTELCLRWLDQHIIENETVIDYGCGSGILAIAAIKLGAKEAIGIDIDPQAITASNDNAQRNEINNDQFRFVLADNLTDTTSCDILLANILANPLIQLAPEIAKLIKPSGKIALSGILQEQADSVLAAYQAYFKFEPIQSKDEWVLLSGIRY
ncbi:50S ribosomal protein L11 methyltransferase [Thiotrichales bacterium 19S3-7]|nr:50S ribosomal protein L11 methyltransferase [Thiotrichales bacterium 19S3-7]MCF6801496.1 50S ribosomal protein L11 methyltransferase [Thiotrichales bacterium 19S3-11]